MPRAPRPGGGTGSGGAPGRRAPGRGRGTSPAWGRLLRTTCLGWFASGRLLGVVRFGAAALRLQGRGPQRLAGRVPQSRGVAHPATMIFQVAVPRSSASTTQRACAVPSTRPALSRGEVLASPSWNARNAHAASTSTRFSVHCGRSRISPGYRLLTTPWSSHCTNECIEAVNSRTSGSSTVRANRPRHPSRVLATSAPPEWSCCATRGRRAATRATGPCRCRRCPASAADRAPRAPAGSPGRPTARPPSARPDRPEPTPVRRPTTRRRSAPRASARATHRASGPHRAPVPRRPRPRSPSEASASSPRLRSCPSCAVGAGDNGVNAPNRRGVGNVRVGSRGLAPTKRTVTPLRWITWRERSHSPEGRRVGFTGDS